MDGAQNSLSPDGAEPLLGWRIWQYTERNGEPCLLSVFWSDLWKPGQAFAGDCKHLHSKTVHGAASPACDCGIYAFAEYQQLAGLLQMGLFRRLIFGAVRLWGRVSICERGYRAEHAYPAALLVPTTTPLLSALADEAWLPSSYERGFGGNAGPIAERLEQRYRCPVLAAPLAWESFDQLRELSSSSGIPSLS